MDIVFERLKMTRKLMSITQEEAARGAGLLQRDISRIENGKVQFIPTPYLKFLHRSGVDLNWIYDKEMNEAQAFRRGKRFTGGGTMGAAADSGTAVMDYEVEISEQQAEQLVIIPVVGLQEESQGESFSVADFTVVDTVSLPSHHLPKGKLYGKEVQGDAMSPNLRGGDIVVSKKLDKVTISNLEIGTAYILLTAKHGIMIRKLKGMDGNGEDTTLSLMAENGQYPDISLKLQDIAFCAQVFMVISKNLS